MDTATAAAPAEAPQRLFTRREYHAMGDSGILGPEDRVELINGKIVTMMPLGPWHVSSTSRLNKALSSAYQDKAIVNVGGPIGLGDHSEPQPDFSILRWRDDFYVTGHAGPADVLLVIEVSDSSRTFDLGTKLDLYAAHGIPEYWVVDRAHRYVRVFQEPAGGFFKINRIYQPGESIPLPGLENAAVAVADTGIL